MMQVSLGTKPNDKERYVMCKQVIEMLSQDLEVWTTTNVNFNYLENFLFTSQPSGKNKDISTTLA